MAKEGKNIVSTEEPTLKDIPFDYPALDFYNRPVIVILDPNFGFEDEPDIVDRSNFKPSAEMKRDMMVSGSSPGNLSKPQYDFDENSSPSKFLSDIEIALRDGKLDKADVQKLKQLAEAAGAEAVDNAIDEAESDKDKARKAKTDELLGVNQSE